MQPTVARHTAPRKKKNCGGFWKVVGCAAAACVQEDFKAIETWRRWREMGNGAYPYITFEWSRNISAQRNLLEGMTCLHSLVYPIKAPCPCFGP